jgi:hypothetical protein
LRVVTNVADEFFRKATEAWPPAKEQLTIRLDADVLKWLKSAGAGLPDAHEPHFARGHGEPNAATKEYPGVIQT